MPVIKVLGTLAFIGILFDAAAFDFFDAFDQLYVNAGFIHDIAVAVGHGNHFGTQFGGLLMGINGHIA